MLRETMFNKLKQIKDLRHQAKTMQNALAGETVSTEHKGVAITMNGNLEILSIKLSPEVKNSDRLEDYLKDAFGETIKKTQQLMAKKMQEMGNLPGLSDLLK